MFDREVKPLLETTCADCHATPGDPYGAPEILEAVPGDYYASLVSRKDLVGCDVENSLLLTKGLDPGHPGGALTGPQHTRVERWLTEEARERFDGVCKSSPPAAATGESGVEAPSGALTGMKALEQLGDCMTLADWQETKMPLVASQLARNGNQQAPCFSCHTSGAGGNWMPDPNGPKADTEIPDAFEKMRRPYSIFNLVRWTVHDEDGSFEDVVQSHRWRDKGTGSEHPSYALAKEYEEYVDAWFTRTYDRWKAGPCVP